MSVARDWELCTRCPDEVEQPLKIKMAGLDEDFDDLIRCGFPADACDLMDDLLGFEDSCVGI